MKHTLYEKAFRSADNLFLNLHSQADGIFPIHPHLPISPPLLAQIQKTSAPMDRLHRIQLYSTAKADVLARFCMFKNA